MAAIRQRDGSDDDVVAPIITPPRPANGAAAAAAAAATASPGAQKIVERTDGQMVVTNSPYGDKRAALGWGTIFAQPAKCFSPEHPNVLIGISSLNGVPGKKRDMTDLMQLYQKKFRVMEHCYPYHNMGEVKHWQGWKAMAGKDFVYTVKASKFLTHDKLLEVDDDIRAHVTNFFETRCSALEPKLGPVLLQLPPTFRCLPSTLARIPVLAQLIPPHTKIAVEFRHPSWFNDDVYAVLRACRWALVATHNFDVGDSPVVDTGAGFMYARLHGSVGQYVGDYGREPMKKWAAIVRRFLDANAANPAARAYVFLNNNESHIASLTSSIVDSTALAQEVFSLPAAAAAAAVV